MENSIEIEKAELASLIGYEADYNTWSYKGSSSAFSFAGDVSDIIVVDGYNYGHSRGNRRSFKRDSEGNFNINKIKEAVEAKVKAHKAYYDRQAENKINQEAANNILKENGVESYSRIAHANIDGVEFNFTLKNSNQVKEVLTLIRSFGFNV